MMPAGEKAPRAALNEGIQWRILFWTAVAMAACAWPMGTVATDLASDSPAQHPIDIMVLLDNSGSMKKNDPKFLTKQAVETFVRGDLPDARIGVLVFDKNAQLVVPLTVLSDETRNAVIAGLDRLNYRGALTNTAAAMERAIYELKTNAREHASKSIILLSDGVIDTGDKDRDRASSRWLQEDLAADAARSGIGIFGIALGNEADFQLLYGLAERTQGAYFRLDQAEDLSQVFERVHKAIVQRATPSAPAARPEPMIETPPAPEAKALEEPLAPEAALPAPSPPKEAAEPAPAAKPVPAAEPPVRDILRNPLYLGAIALSAALLLLVVAWRVLGHRPQSEASAPLPPRMVPEPIPPAFLYDLSGATGRASHTLTKKVTLVGRIATDQEQDVGQLVIERTTIGRQHALIEYKHHGFWVTDRRSRNGTFVNDEQVMGGVCLKHGDTVRFHDVAFKFSMAGLEGADETLAAAIPKWALEGETAFMPGVTAAAAQARAKPGEERDSQPSAKTPLAKVDSEDPTLPTQRTIKQALDDYFEK